MHVTARRTGPVLAGLVAVFTLLLSVLALSPAHAADPRMENKERPWLSGPVCLEINEAAGWVGAPAAVEWCSQNGTSMQWTAVHVSDGYYQLRPQHIDKKDMCLAVQGRSHSDGTQIVQEKCSSADSQEFRFVYKSYANSKRYYEVVARHSNKCLDKSGWNVIQWNCHGGDWQQWSRPF